MSPRVLFLSLLGIPLLAGAVASRLRAPRRILDALIVGALTFGAAAAALAVAVRRSGPVFAAGGWFHADALSAFHLGLLAVVFGIGALFARSYFEPDFGGAFSLRRARRFGTLWSGTQAAMTLVLISNNLGLMWVGVEATTLLTAFLICLDRHPRAVEAMWKYLVLCSVGVTFAFMGTLLIAASAQALHLPAAEALLWTRLREEASALHPATVKAGFLFLIVGYGTKAGLAPMHNWLPDAHSQAPAPVSALFSGFMLNLALYCLMRYVPLVEAVPGNAGWGLRLLLLFGLISIGVAAAFIVFQHDVKRLLAYHSVEHLGIITLGLGLGGLGTVAALFHTLNHAVCKTLGFCCAGRLGQLYGTHDMRRMGGLLRASPLWGTGLVLSLLALIGLAPFALFLSELMLVRAAVDRRAYVALAGFLIGSSIVFVGALRHAIAMAWGPPACEIPRDRPRPTDAVVVWGCLAALVALGLWLPAPLRSALESAARIIQRIP